VDAYLSMDIEERTNLKSENPGHYLLPGASDFDTFNLQLTCVRASFHICIWHDVTNVEGLGWCTCSVKTDQYRAVSFH
jgi:hypothetical protein